MARVAGLKRFKKSGGAAGGKLRGHIAKKLEIHDHWHPWRKLLGKYIRGKRIDLVVAVATFINLFMVILITDWHSNEKESAPAWMQALSFLTLALFTTESLCRIFVYRHQVLFHPFYLLDVLVSIVDISVAVFAASQDFVPMLSLLRCWRIIRLFEVLLRMDQFRELYLMIHGFRGAIMALIWAAAIIGSTLVFCAIFAVQIIHPLNEEIAEKGIYAGCDRCPRAFSSVWNSILTFIQQIITGDSWGMVTLPIIEAHPSAALFFFPVYLIIDLAVMNLVLMVVVDQAEAARERDLKQALAEKEAHMMQAKTILTELCQSMDEDKSGNLSLEELTDGAQHNEEFSDILKMMDIGIADLETVFAIMDTDESGTVEYGEFCDQLHKMKTDDSHTMLVLVRHQMKQVLGDVRKQMQFHHTEMKMQQEELTMLQNDFLSRLDNHGDLLKKLVVLLEGKEPQVQRREMQSGLGVPEARFSDNLARDASSANTFVNESSEGHDRHFMDVDCMAGELKQLKAWLSQELTPILKDDVVPVLQDVKLKLDASWAQAIAGTADIAGSSKSLAPTNAADLTGVESKAVSGPPPKAPTDPFSVQLHACNEGQDLSKIALLQAGATELHDAVDEQVKPCDDDQLSVAESFVTAGGAA